MPLLPPGEGGSCCCTWSGYEGPQVTASALLKNDIVPVPRPLQVEGRELHVMVHPWPWVALLWVCLVRSTEQSELKAFLAILWSSLSVVGPQRWDSLPGDIRMTTNLSSYKAKCKTCFFSQPSHNNMNQNTKVLSQLTGTGREVNRFPCAHIRILGVTQERSGLCTGTSPPSQGEQLFPV